MKSISTDSGECLCQVCEGHEEWKLWLSACLLCMLYDGDVSSGSACIFAILRFRVDSVRI